MRTHPRHAIHTSLLACALLLTACSKPAEEAAAPAPATAPATVAEAPAATAEPAAPAAPTSPASRVVDQLFTAEVIGMNLADVDKLAGPAVRSEDRRHLYRADGCELTLRTDAADKAVQAVEVAITPSCQLSLEPVLGGYAGEPALQLQALRFGNFGQMLGGGASYYADCLSLCGNAADPVVSLHMEGPRALHFMEFAIEAPLVNGPALNAAETWRSAMEAAESETYVVDTRFNCEPQRFQPVAEKAFAPVQPAVFIFGRELGYGGEANDCA